MMLSDICVDMNRRRGDVSVIGRNAPHPGLRSAIAGSDIGDPLSHRHATGIAKLRDMMGISFQGKRLPRGALEAIRQKVDLPDF